jgi:hypothetical protein
MPVITKPSQVQKNQSATIQLSKSELAALPLVSSSVYFSDQSNWNKIILFYLSDNGNQLIRVTMRADQATPSGIFKTSAKARNLFQIQRIVIEDFDGGYLNIPRSALVTSEFDISFQAPVDPDPVDPDPVDPDPIDPTLRISRDPDFVQNTSVLQVIPLVEVPVFSGVYSIYPVAQAFSLTSIQLPFITNSASTETLLNAQVRILSAQGFLIGSASSDISISRSPSVQLAQSYQTFNFPNPVLISDATLTVQLIFTNVSNGGIDVPCFLEDVNGTPTKVKAIKVFGNIV